MRLRSLLNIWPLSGRARFVSMKEKITSTITVIVVVLAIISASLVVSTSIVAAQSTPTAVIYVSVAGSDTAGNGSSTNPYATISHAISAAPANGATVIVAAGVYNEMINITKPITLQSQSSQPANTIIDATGKMYGVFVSGSAAAGTVIQGLTVENADNHGILVQDTSNVIIMNNVIQHNGLNPTVCPEPPTPPSGPCIAEDKAIELVGTSNSVVASNLVSNNLADGGIGVSDDGQINPGAFTGGISNPAVGNVISGNTLTSNQGGCGVVVAAYNAGQGVANNLVTGNRVVNGNAGIVIAADTPHTSATNNTVTENTVIDNQLPGIIVHSNTPGDLVSGTIVMRNVVSGNGGFGPKPTGIILIGAFSPVQDTSISGNTVHSEYFGISVANATGTTVLNNLIDSTVSVPLDGVALTQSPMASTSADPIAPMQPTPTEQTNTISTAMYVGVGALVLALIALVVALTALRKRKTT